MINRTNRCTARAHANIAVAKYWGKRNVELNLPWFDSVSFSVDGLVTETTAVWEDGVADSLMINGDLVSVKKVKKILDVIRLETGLSKGCQLRSKNSFAISSGLASSASGCAAAAFAAARAAGLDWSLERLSGLARLGSGSASRSIHGGWCRWHAGVQEDGSDSYSTQIAPWDYWPLCVFVVQVSDGRKPVSSTSCMMASMRSPFWEAYAREASGASDLAQDAIERRDFRAFSEVMHRGAMMLHALVMTCHPPVCYFQPDSIKVLQYVLDATGWIDVCCTMDAGANVIVVCEPSCREDVRRDLEAMGVRFMETGIGGGVEIV